MSRSLDHVRYKALVDWLDAEQRSLWHDLDQAIRSAINGRWSIRAEEIARRLLSLLKLGVEPTPWGEISWDLVDGGIYSELRVLAGNASPFATASELNETYTLMNAQYVASGALPRTIRDRKVRYEAACDRMIESLQREDG